MSNNFLFAGVWAADDLPVTQQCLGCLCEAASQCHTNIGCNGDVCGPFKITWGYWADGGKPTVNNEPSTAERAFHNCATDTYCAALAVQGYMAKFQQVNIVPKNKSLNYVVYF